MEINKKLKIFSVTIAILAIILSVITTVYKPEIRSQGKTPEEIAIELMMRLRQKKQNCFQRLRT